MITVELETHITLIDCGHCHKQALGPRGWHSCMDCIEAIVRRNLCPDCASDTRVIVTADHMHLDERHDPTCPTWSAFCTDNNRSPDDDIIFIPTKGE